MMPASIRSTHALRAASKPHLLDHDAIVEPELSAGDVAHLLQPTREVRTLCARSTSRTRYQMEQLLYVAKPCTLEI